ncbi:MAG: four helix bundle protein [Pseudomonadota bacterium]
MARKHHELKVWQEAMGLVTVIYRATSTFPADERWGLTGQMRRAAVSIPSNIAEGAGRSGVRDFCRFLMVARGSLAELETQVLIARSLGYMGNDESIDKSIDSVFAMLAGLINLRRRASS